jgi:AmmeMemoRadiSam system protein B
VRVFKSPLVLLFILALSTVTALAQVVALDYTVRQPVKAGSWYPGEADALRARIRQLASETADRQLDPQHGKLRALIVPHAGYDYSGSTAAAGYKLLKGKKYRRVVVIGAAHYYNDMPGMSVLDVDAYQTPLGKVELDRAAIAPMYRSPLVISHPYAHDREHSIEMQLPFLQAMLAPGWKLVPILIGDLTRLQYQQAGRLVAKLLDEDTLLVVSGDFVHYGPGYGFVPFPHDAQTAQRIAHLDKGIVEHIRNIDPGGLLRYRNEMDLNDCVYPPAMVLLNLLPDDTDATKVTIIRYQTSGAVTGNYRNSVSYLAIAFQRDVPIKHDIE